MKIKFPDTFPHITDEHLLQPLSEFEKEKGIKGYIHDNAGKFGRAHSGYFLRETEEQFTKKFKRTYDRVTKILQKKKHAS
jgi:hypothetical protein